jgi:putative ABC transport system permease protein
VTLTGQGDAQLLASLAVNGDYFRVLGAQAVRGRLPGPDDARPGASPVAVLSHAAWQRRFASDPNVLGRNVLLDGVGTTVVGVLPKGFAVPGWEFAELWTAATPPEEARGRGQRSFKVVARLRPGVTLAQARAEMQAISDRLARAFPDTNTGRSANVVAMHEDLFDRDFRLTSFLVFGAVGLVLLIGCANVANLLMARAATRDTELALRAALGASRVRLLRQLLTETGLLSLAGAALGLLGARWGVELMVRLLPADLPRVGEIRLDLRVAMFALGASLIAALVSGLWPAIQATRQAPSEPLREGSARTTRSRRRAHSVLVASEVALAVVLLAAAGLLVRTLGNLRHVDPGFETARGLTARLTLPAARYPESALAPFFDRLRERLEAIPGVARAGAVNYLPLAGTNSWLLVSFEGRPLPPPGQEPRVGYVVAGAHYFEALGVDLRAGRALQESDVAGAPPVAMVNETLARRYFPGESAVGKRLRRGREDRPDRPWLEIVGVVRDVRHEDIREAPRAELYLPIGQRPERGMDIVVRGASAGAVSLADVQKALADLDPSLALARPRPLRNVLENQTSSASAFASLLGAFAAAALALAVIGLYGVVALSVGQTKREIGIRLALGAPRRSVVGLVLRRWLPVAAAGLVAGLSGALGLGRLVQSVLFGVAGNDMANLASVSALLLAVTVIAAGLPALRASRVDPAAVLRVE